MPTYAFAPTIDELLTGAIDYAILPRPSGFIAWSRTREGRIRPDETAARADLRDMLIADGFTACHKIAA
ncbi:MAG: hypothetical protein A3E78_12230 [Alphaproteobacteria bacterium RIFCSPHIGHO2_12_FULL_63_12]|nr:MAG: hypothetical protein A3E78_12230 [Alphaproteobacteria bacterium RIFCSPHIGHO2_12_FULL_63_12]